MILRRKGKGSKIRYGVRIDRYGRQKWIGTYDTLAEARQAEARARVEVKGRTRMTADAWVDFWLEGYREKVKDSSYDTAEVALRGFKADFRGIPLAAIDPISAEEWARENKWRVPTVVNLMNAATKKRLIEFNPFAGLGHKGEGRKRITPLTVDEVARLAACADQVHGPKMKALVLFLAYTGMRPGEVFALEWPDIDFTASRIHVERRVYRGRLDLPKSNRTRVILLTDEAREALLELPRDGRWIFTGKRDGRLSQSLMTWYWAPIVARFDRKVDPYELRHFAAHYLYVTRGFKSRLVAAQLGHDGPELIEKLYGHGDVGAIEELEREYHSNVVPLRRLQSE